MNPNDPSQPNNNPEIDTPSNPTIPPAPQPQQSTPQVVNPVQPTPPNTEMPLTEVPQAHAAFPMQNSAQQSVPPAAAGGEMQQLAPKQRRKKLAALLIIVGVAIVILGGAAAAYVGLVVPNKPENVLSQAFKNTLLEKNFTADGTMEMQAADNSKDDAMPAIKAAFKSQANVSDKTEALDLKLTVSGVEFPVEIRYVDKNLYFKIGDLGTIKPLVSPYTSLLTGGDSAAANKLFDDIAELISNKWVLVDSTILDASNISCLADSYSLTEKDIQTLQDAYSKNPFVTIKSHADDTVNSQSAIKYELAIDDNKTAKYIDGLSTDDLSFMKALNKCGDAVESIKPDTSELADDDITPLTVWVDKDNKRIIKVASKSTGKDALKSNIKGTFEAAVSYDNVAVEKPADAKPVLQLLGELETLFPLQNYTSGFSEFDSSSSI